MMAATVLLTLLTTQEARAAQVTYHILTKPFSTLNSDGSTRCADIRMEALRVVVKNTTQVDGLPADYKTPLMNADAYKYYPASSVTTSGSGVQIYENNSTKFITYSVTGAQYASLPQTITENTDVYVTYEYSAADKVGATMTLDLTGDATYNISVGEDGFLAYNQKRGNRPAVVPTSWLYDLNDLASDEPVETKNGFSHQGVVGKNYYFKFRLGGDDPYNIIIALAYDGDAVYQENVDLKIRGPERMGNVLFSQIGSSGAASNMWISNEMDYDGRSHGGVWTVKRGWFRSLAPIFNSFTLLNHVNGGYTLVGTKINSDGKNWQPNSSQQYMHLQRGVSDGQEGKDPKIQCVNASDASQMKFYTVKRFTFKVRTPFGNDIAADMPMETYEPLTAISLDHVPDVLQRKYVSFTGEFYSDAALTQPITTYAQAEANGNVIYLKYRVDGMPFKALAPGADYAGATWYEMTDAGSQQSDGRKVRWDATVFKNNGTADNYEKESEFAFVGDPYDLRVVSRSQTESDGDLRYVGAATGSSLGMSATDDADYQWEIAPDDVSDGSFVLRKKGTHDAPACWQWNVATAGNTLQCTTAAVTRVKVMTLPTMTYTFHIIDMEGRIAAEATATQPLFTTLNAAAIPPIIYSPYLTGETVTFYKRYTDVTGEGYRTRADLQPADQITQLANNLDIYVAYTTSTLNYKPFKLNDTQVINVQLNGRYLYGDAGDILSNASATAEDLTKHPYEWQLLGLDPYAMIIKNVEVDGYVKLNGALTDDAAGTALTFTATLAEGTRFIAKSSGSPNMYEVMVATGSGTDASNTYYNMGRPSAVNNVKVYSDDVYQHTWEQLRFRLEKQDGQNVTYHLIDNDNNVLLTRTVRESLGDAPELPSDIWSPLVAQYHYYAQESDIAYNAATHSHSTAAGRSELASITISTPNVYVTYDTDDAVDLNGTTMYLLKYATGTRFRAEDGSDKLEPEPGIVPVYPYCNGDANFFVYGTEQYALQQQGASSTRTRWAWYLESDNNDPYHVKVVTRQTETYNNMENQGYFRTYVPSDYAGHVVTGMTWPSISGVPATDYMVLGSTGAYRLMTSHPIDDGTTNENRVVNSFEQYWKTFDTVRKVMLGESSAKADIDDPITVPAEHRDVLTTTWGLHRYVQWAYAKRWNGYNKDGKTSKGWEEMEHWFQTVQMGEGYFDLVKTVIDPALILLDQHGWEVMRQPLPSGIDDPERLAKLQAIRQYNSPMVKEYAFWATAKKRTGFHQYYQLDKRIGGNNYTATSLANYPSFNLPNARDAKGNIMDQYVTYIVKDEYAQSYNPATATASAFLIEQDGHFVSATDASTVNAGNAVPVGGMNSYIIDNIATLSNGSKDAELWYLKPNANIDDEMGYSDSRVSHDWGSTNINAYTAAAYRNERTAQYINDATLGKFSFSNGFDPYNIQIANKKYSTSYLKTNATGTELDDGIAVGTYSGDAAIVLGTRDAVQGNGQDNRYVQMTNATFMAVQDANGNMQLMPRFDQVHRMTNFGTLEDPQTHPAGDQEGTQTTLLFRPLIYNYRIIDYSGNEALRYQSAGDLVPAIPDYLQSPLANEYRFFKTWVGGTVKDEITASLAAAGLTASGGGENVNVVYVRYGYNASADVDHLLQGRWVTMKLADKDAVYDGGVKQGTEPRPNPMDGTHSEWQWKLTATPQSVPDPYAVGLYSRSLHDAAQVNGQVRFALLSHPDGGYALAVAGTGTFGNYVNAAAMNTTTAATTGNTASKVTFDDDVIHNYTYKVYTNGTNGSHPVKYGTLAISAEQTGEEAKSNEYVPLLPEAARTPLLTTAQYRYYENEADMGSEALELQSLDGLWDDEVYVRYTTYDMQESTYHVPNERNATGTGQVAVGNNSHDAPVSLLGDLLYNIIWEPDKMMASNDGDNIVDDGSHALAADAAHEWMLAGNDPYAIVLHHNLHNKNVKQTSESTCGLSADFSTFMLLHRDGYDHGVLQLTGGTKCLSGYGNELSETPDKFIIFALATHRVMYHLVIQNIGNTETIYYPNADTPIVIEGTTQRNLTAYPMADYDAGHISLGDSLKVPATMFRPNVVYDFYVGDIYDVNPDGTRGALNNELTTAFKGHKLTRMEKDSRLLNTEVCINIVYTFNGDLSTNAGEGFVTDPNQNRWYTVETSGSTPWLAQYTKAWGMEVKKGRETRYTNDFLWSPVGDPYGFKMYNRYIYKTNGQTNLVMTTTSAPAAGNQFVVAEQNAWDVYELLTGSTAGYFRMHAVSTTGGTPLYIYNDNGVLKLNTTATDLTFGLSTDLITPYYERAGYVGGLNEKGKALYEAVDENPSLTTDLERLMARQTIVYNDANIMTFKPGYYRLHSQPELEGISAVRYASGYNHALERDPDGDDSESDALPLHFYEREGVSTDFETLGSGFTVSAATRGQLSILPPDQDPAAVFYISGTYNAAILSTQGLQVKENRMTAGAGTPFYLMDIGGAVLLIHDNAVPNDRKYLCFDQTPPENIYDLQFKHDVPTDYAKWCLQPASNMPLKVATHDGGDGYYYATFCAPFDVLLTSDKDTAYICKTWSDEVVFPTPVGDVNTGDHEGNHQFVPAGTPVIIRTAGTTGSVLMRTPSDAPTTSLTNALSGTYLEQLLGAGNEVYTFGLKYTSTVTKDGNYADNGEITAPAPTAASKGVGFYVNANLNMERGPRIADWVPRNNRYVQHNKVYYRSTAALSAPRRSEAATYIPVVFGGKPALDTPDANGAARLVTDGNVYDLQGRPVATAEQVADGSWRQRLQPGIYIVGGKKVVVK